MRADLETRAAAMREFHAQTFLARERALNYKRGPNGWRFAAAAGAPIRFVLSAVSAFYGVPQTTITGKSQIPEIVEPRHVAMYLAHHLCRRSSSTIGRVFKRHHTTVLSAVEKLQKAIDADVLVAAKVHAIRRQITDGADKDTRVSPVSAICRVRQLHRLAAMIQTECEAIERELLLFRSDNGVEA